MPSIPLNKQKYVTARYELTPNPESTLWRKMCLLARLVVDGNNMFMLTLSFANARKKKKLNRNWKSNNSVNRANGDFRIRIRFVVFPLSYRHLFVLTSARLHCILASWYFFSISRSISRPLVRFVFQPRYFTILPFKRLKHTFVFKIFEFFQFIFIESSLLTRIHT